MALLHFAEQRVEVAVMEAGMGGRFDATGVCAGVLTILTPVSLDHCAFLGEELTTIARDKAGLVRPGRPVVVAPQPPEALDVIARQCRVLASPCHRFGTEFSASWEEGSLRYRGMGGTLTGLRPGIGGNFQAVNAACALAGAELLGAAGFSIPPEAMRRGIEGASWPGRMEFFGEAPRLLLDGAHNPAAAHALAAALAEVPRERLILVLGVMGDKDAGGIIAPLLPLAAESVAVTPALDRAMPSAALAELCRKGGVACTDGGTVPAGLSLARSRAGAADLILVTGSLFTVGEARAFLLGRQFEPMRG
jgi:dihydrofolate synthase/folylpolyglutamate synthase